MKVYVSTTLLTQLGLFTEKAAENEIEILADITGADFAVVGPDVDEIARTCSVLTGARVILYSPQKPDLTVLKIALEQGVEAILILPMLKNKDRADMRLAAILIVLVSEE